MAFLIDKEKCVGCGACSFMCIFNVPTKLDAGGSKYEINPKRCLGCGQCVNICPNNAIYPAPEHKQVKRIYIEPDLCNGDGKCIIVCKAHAHRKTDDGKYEIDQSRCFKCTLCKNLCKENAIKIEYEEL